MKRENNELDDFLQQKVDEAQFEFKESYWDKMEALLDEEEKPKKRFLFWRGLSVFLGVALLSTVAFLWPKSQKNTTQTASTTARAENTTAPPFVAETVTSVPDGQNQQPSVNVSNAAPSNFTNSSNAVNSSAVENSSTQKTIQPTSKGSENRKNATRARSAISNNPNFESDVVDNESTNSGVVSVGPNSAHMKKVKKGKNGAKPLEEKTSAIQEKDKIKQDVKNPDKYLPSTSKMETTVQINGRDMKAIDTNIYYAREPRDETQFNPRYFASLQNYIPERLEQVTVVTFQPASQNATMEKAVTENTPALKKTDTSSSQKVSKPLSWFALLGANFNKGFKGNALNTLPWGVSPFLSLGVERQLSKKISISTQVGFTYFNGLNVEQKATQYKYSFGLDSSDFFTVNYKRLWQVYVPLTLSYQLAARHQLFAGVGGSFAFDVNSLVEDKKNSTIYASNGYRDGLSAWDVLAHVGYAYQLHSRLSAMLFWQQGFSDVTKNNVFKQDSKHLQSKVSVGLKYNFKRNGK